MSLSDLKKRFMPGKKDNGADPAHAFGSEEQVMAAFSQQNYTQPQPREKTSVLSGLRQRLSRPREPRENNAPVYSADTYAQPSAPDLGWEAAFDPNGAPRPGAQQAAAPALSAEERFRAFQDTVYASPARPGYYGGQSAYGYAPSRSAPVYEEIGGRRVSGAAAPALSRPTYEEITLQPKAAREKPLSKPVYEEIHLQGEASSEAEITPMEDISEEAPPQFDEYDPGEPPYAEAESAEQAPRPGDLQYFFWSGSIVAGTLLTLFAFIYACTI